MVFCPTCCKVYAPKKVLDTPGPDRVYVGLNPTPTGLHPSSVLHVPNSFRLRTPKVGTTCGLRGAWLGQALSVKC